MNTDQAVKDILSQSFDEYTKKCEKNEESMRKYVAIREDMTFVKGKSCGVCR